MLSAQKYGKNLHVNYSPFGAVLPGRNHSTTSYDYGFNGQIKTDEMAGQGNRYSAEYWEYSPRLAQRWNPDPVVKHHESPYACLSNNPIWFIDPNGDDAEESNQGNDDGSVKKVVGMMQHLSEQEKLLKERREEINNLIDFVDEISSNIDRIEFQQNLATLTSLPASHAKLPKVATVPVESLLTANDVALSYYKIMANQYVKNLSQTIESFNEDVTTFNQNVGSLKQALSEAENIYNKSMIVPTGETLISIYPKVESSAKDASFVFSIAKTQFAFGQSAKTQTYTVNTVAKLSNDLPYFDPISWQQVVRNSIRGANEITKPSKSSVKTTTPSPVPAR